MNKLYARMQGLYWFCILFLFSQNVFACPMCAGTDTGKDRYTVWILGAFVLLTYIPFTIIYRLTKKSKEADRLRELSRDDNPVSSNP